MSNSNNIDLSNIAEEDSNMQCNNLSNQVQGADGGQVQHQTQTQTQSQAQPQAQVQAQPMLSGSQGG
jgi:hypothetical protein